MAITVVKGVFGRYYAGGPPIVTTWSGEAVPLSDDADIGDVVSGDVVEAECARSNTWPELTAVRVRRSERR